MDLLYKFSAICIFPYGDKYLVLLDPTLGIIWKVDVSSLRQSYCGIRPSEIFGVSAILVNGKLLLVGSDGHHLKFACINVDDMTLLWEHSLNYSVHFSHPFFRFVSYGDTVYVFKWWWYPIPGAELKIPYYQVYVVNLTSGTINVVNLFKKRGYCDGLFYEHIKVTPILYREYIVCSIHRMWVEGEHFNASCSIALYDLNLHLLHLEYERSLIKSTKPLYICKMFKSDEKLFFIFSSSNVPTSLCILAEFKLDDVKKTFSLNVLVNTSIGIPLSYYRELPYSIAFVDGSWIISYGSIVARYFSNGSMIWMRVLSDPASSILGCFTFFAAGCNGFLMVAPFYSPFIGLVALSYDGEVYWFKYLKIAHPSPGMHCGLLFHDSKIFVILVNGTLLCIG